MDVRSESYQYLPLLPEPFRYVGYALISLSLGAAYLYFAGGKPAFFELPVFAFVTSYAETRWLVVAQTNILDELAVVCSVTGLLFVGFSKRRNEKNLLTLPRIKAFYYSVYLTAGLWIFLYLVVYGWPVVVVSAGMFILFLVIYIFMLRLFSSKKNVQLVNHLLNKTREEGKL